jgi:hypothetical protein
MTQLGTNTLTCEIKCPKCQKTIKPQIGFRAGTIRQRTYKMGDKLDWEGPGTVPEARPSGGNLKTIGYFECDNLHCSTWQDCYPEVQEALIVIESDIISHVKATTHRPNEILFDILEPKLEPKESA